MKTREKLALLENIFDLENGELTEEIELSELNNWDSVAKISLVILMDEMFNKKLSREQIRSFLAVKDILNFME